MKKKDEARLMRYQNVSLRPYKMLSTSLHTRMYFVLGALFLQLGMLFLTQSWKSLTIIACTVLATLLAVTADLFVARRKKVFSYLYAVIEGILIGFFIPSTYPPLTVFFIALCVVLICTYMLGNTPNTWVNPVALTTAICWLIGMKAFPEFAITPSMLQVRNAGALLLQNGSFPLLPVDAQVTAALNQRFFYLFNVSVPDGFISLFWDTGAVIPAFRFNLLTIVSSILLISFDVVQPLIPMLFLFVYLFLVRVLSPVFYGGMIGQGDMLLALLTSGTLFVALFLLQWVGTAPHTKAGKVLYGIVAGIVAFLIVGCGLSAAGAVFVVLVLNIVSSMIQALETVYADYYVHAVLLPKSKALTEEGIHA